jgi:hypothetical protein
MVTPKKPDSEYDEVKTQSSYNDPAKSEPKPADTQELGDSAEAQQKADDATVSAQREAELQETMTRAKIQQQKANIAKAETDYQTYKNQLDEAIKTQQQIIDEAAASGYFPVDEGAAAYANLNKLKKQREQADVEYQNYVDSANTNLSGMETEEAKLLVYISQFSTPEYVQNPSQTYKTGMFSSVPTLKQGGTIQSPGGMTLFSGKQYKPIPGPAAGPRPGSIGAQISSVFTGALESSEKFFGDIAKSGAKLGSDLKVEAETAKLGGEDVKAGLLASATVAAGVGTGLFDFMTFPLRPVLWGETVGGAIEFLSSPAESFESMSMQAMENPLFVTGYAGGMLLGSRLPSFFSMGESAYNRYAKKIPLLNEYYYASKFPVNTAYTEFNISNNLALEFTGEGGSRIRGAAKFWTSGIPTGSLKQFKDVARFRNPLSIEAPQWLVSYGESVSKLRGAIKLWSQGRGKISFPEFNLGGEAKVRLPWVKSIQVSERLYYSPLARDIRAIGDIGKKFTVEEQIIGEAGEIAYKPTRRGRFTEIAPKVSALPETQNVGGSVAKGMIKYGLTPSGPKGTSFFGPTRSAVKFFKMQGVNLGAYSFESTVSEMRRRSSPNRGFSRIESGIVGKPTRLTSVKRGPVAEVQLVESGKQSVKPEKLISVTGGWGSSDVVDSVTLEPVDRTFFNQASMRVREGSSNLVSEIPDVAISQLIYSPQKKESKLRETLLPKSISRKASMQLNESRQKLGIRSVEGLRESQLVSQVAKVDYKGKLVETQKIKPIEIQKPRYKQGLKPQLIQPPENSPIAITGSRKKKKKEPQIKAPQLVTFETRRYRTSTPEMILGKTKRRFKI